MTKPQKQMNLIHQQLLGELVKIREATRIETVYRKGKEVQVEVPVPTLAGNVSDLNCNLAARRWAA